MIAALIPCFNAESLVGPVVRSTRCHLPETWVVDDGSRDASADVAAREGAKVIRHETNRGKGSALLTGFRTLLARDEIEAILTLDADGQHDPASIPLFVQAYVNQGVEIVVGHRLGDTAAIPPLRRFANRYSTRLISWIAGQPILDAQCGYRLYGAVALHRLLPHLREGRYELETDVLILAARAAMQIAFVPIATVYTAEAHRASQWRAVRDSYRIGRVLLRHCFARHVP